MKPDRAYREAEGRLRESIRLRSKGLRGHTYPRHDADLAIMRRHHARHGVPPLGFLRRVWRALGGRGG